MRRWVQLQLDSDTQDQVWVTVTGTSSGRSAPRRALEMTDVGTLEGLSAQLRRYATQRVALPEVVRRKARALYEDLFAGETGRVFDQERGLAGSEPINLRLSVMDPLLASTCWEAMRGPGEHDGELATSGRVLVTRVPVSSRPAADREVEGALRVLAIGTSEMQGAVEDLEASLADAIASGHLAWLPPVIGTQTQWRHLVRRLRTPPAPHVIHFIGHGRVGPTGPELQLEGTPETSWQEAGLFARTLADRVGDTLRLVYLESCSGADPGGLASTAEIIAGQGVEAVVAHLWPVASDAARQLASAFYEELTDAHGASGDVAAAMSGARLSLAGDKQTAEHLGGVVHARKGLSQVFDFRYRELTAPLAGAPATGDSALHQRLASLIDDGATVVVGESFAREDTGLDGLDEAVRRKLGEHTPLSLFSMLQLLELTEERTELEDALEDTVERFWSDDPERMSLPFLGLARIARPGVFLTMHWLPVLEMALAEAQPQHDVLVLQTVKPSLIHQPKAYLRRRGERSFSKLVAAPQVLDLENTFVVLRLYGGYRPDRRKLAGDPVLTEDNQLEALRFLDQLPSPLLARLRTRPTVLLGLSAQAWSHRELLRRLTDGQPLRPGSLVSLLPGREGERLIWEAPHGPAGRAGVVEVWTHEQVLGALA